MNENQDIEILANKNQVKLFNDKQEDNNNTTSDVNVNVSVSNSNENNEKLNQDYNQIKEVKLNNEESSNLNSNNKQEDTSTNNNKNTNVTSNNSKKDPKLMTLQEQVEFYKDQFTKTKKLFIHYEKENKINEQKVAKLTERIKQYEPQTGETIKILYKFSHSNSTFYYLESQKSSYFIREDLIKEIFPNAFTDNDIPEYSYEKEIKQQEETIQQIILQYDERIIRLKNEVENYEKSFLAFKDSKNASSKVIDNLKLFYDEGMKTLIRNANEVFLLLKSSSEIDYSDDQMQVDLFSNMSKHIEEFKQSDIIGSTKSVISNDSSMSISNNISNLNEVFNAKWLNELKLFTANLLKSYHDSLNSLTKTNNELIDQKTKWQNTLDQLIANNEVELNSKQKMIENFKSNIEILNKKVFTIEQDKNNILKVKDQQIDLLNKELTKKINVNLLKAVIMQFLTTNDASIQESLLPVIYTALQFSDFETDKIKEFRKKNSSLFSMFFTTSKT